ncbi:MAG: nucleoside triphosphate pyrophosphohydrolase [Clostridia bacterium]|nr:nucleoside triphosphate pyrophosphohydrolase [Clostridia bacterium]
MKSITIIPLATPNMLTFAASAALKAVDKLFIQTLEHPISRILSESGVIDGAVSFDEYYNDSFDFDELNERIAARLIAELDGVQSVGFAVLGRGAGEALYASLKLAADRAGAEVKLLPSSGYASAALAAVFNSGVAYFSDYDIRTASSLRAASVGTPLVIEEVDTLLRAGEVKLELGEYYPDEFTVHIASMDASGEYSVRSLPLRLIDAGENAPLYGAATVLVLERCTLEACTRHGFEALMAVMRRLRAPGGCPWDAEQTHRSLRSSLIEEAYEVLDALDREDLTALEEELGDLLLQIVFHAIIEEERSEFNMRDVITGIVNKLIYRHPHVFGEVNVSGSDEVLVNWENLKQKEKHLETVADAMRAVPAAFPALMRSYKIQKKAAHIGFDWTNALDALQKVAEETAEVREALGGGSADDIYEEVGDLLFACVNVARLVKVDPELALSAATDKFMRRFILMERMIIADGLDFGALSLEEMDQYWDLVKKSE